MSNQTTLTDLTHVEYIAPPSPIDDVTPAKVQP